MKVFCYGAGRTRLRRPVLLAVVVAGVVASVTALPRAYATVRPWNQCCGVYHWPVMPGWSGRGTTGGGAMGGSMPRHRYAMSNGLPPAYRSLANPLPRTGKTIGQGGVVYAQNCASCHGATGAGDGTALSPPPANLQLLTQMPMAQWDPFMYWAVSEGGVQFGTAMPAFKGTLSARDRWAVIAYIQARLPQTPR